MLVENINLNEYDTMVEKARAILIDENDKIIICEIAESLSLPGGSVEQNEDYHKTIIRELEEEVGVILSNIEEITTLYYKHENFPNLKNGGIGTRLNIVHYFYSRIKDIHTVPTKYTDYERDNHMTVKKYTYSELCELIKLPSNNSYKKFMDFELISILEYAKNNGYYLGETNDN